MSVADIFKGNKNFVPFNKNTGNGRNIYIDVALIPRYIELTQSKAVTPLRLNHGITALRALAGGFNSQSNLNNAFSHRTSVDGVEIAYTLLQRGSGEDGGVYVTDLRLRANAANADKAGHYDVLFERNAWTAARKTSDSKISGFRCVISAGPVVNVKAITATREAKVIDAGYTGEANAQQTATDCGRFLATNSSYMGNFELFFTPSSQVDGEGTWLTVNQKRLSSTALAKNLANLIRDAEINPKLGWTKDPLKWFVRDDGAKVLLQALKLLSASGVKEITKSVFVFSNARESIAALKFALKNVGITLTPDMIINSEKFDTSAKVRQQFSLQNGLAFVKNQKLQDNGAIVTKVATNSNLLKEIESFEGAVKKQLIGAATGWS